eukprot:6438442-Amphidinium_carterae.1
MVAEEGSHGPRDGKAHRICVQVQLLSSARGRLDVFLSRLLIKTAQCITMQETRHCSNDVWRVVETAKSLLKQGCLSTVGARVAQLRKKQKAVSKSWAPLTSVFENRRFSASGDARVPQ